MALRMAVGTPGTGQSPGWLLPWRQASTQDVNGEGAPTKLCASVGTQELANAGHSLAPHTYRERDSSARGFR